MSEIEDRRQRALEALHDSARSASTGLLLADPVKVAIEVATQVKITTEIIAATGQTGEFWKIYEALARAFRAAGFEVIE